MSHRINAIAVAALLAAGGAATWMGKPEREVSMTSVGELWADVFRDADQFGLQLTRVPDKDEMALGEKMARGIVRGTATSPMWEVYVAAVGQSLVKHARRGGIRYQFHVIDAPAENAFALPGGQVFLYTGLLRKMRSEAELAGVLGHEIAHVDLRHCIERHQYEMRVPGGELLRIGQGFMQIGYAQYQEMEADKAGLRMALAAGYDPQATVDLFGRVFRARLGRDLPPHTPLEELAALSTSMLTDYFRSHPPSAERMRRLSAAIEEYRREHRGQRQYRGVENLRRKIARSQQEFDGEFVRL
ncbi:MAG: M48 family metalloprotease [Bryobacterales bacterium]|nr:M48 family metalloprotease [Bryobacterales bacterium]